MVVVQELVFRIQQTVLQILVNIYTLTIFNEITQTRNN